MMTHSLSKAIFFRNFIVCLALIFSFLGCSKEEVKEPAKEKKVLAPTVLELQFETGNHLNPDTAGRASPIVLRIYQLEAIDNFNSSDFFAIYENDQNLLGKDIKYRKELELKPLANQSMTMDVKPDANYFAVFAAFRDLDTAQWKASLPIEANKTTAAKIHLDNFSVEIGKPEAK